MGRLEGAQLRKLNPFFPRPFPAECYPVKSYSPSWPRRSPTPKKHTCQGPPLDHLSRARWSRALFKTMVYVWISQRCIGAAVFCDQQGWPTLAPLPCMRRLCENKSASMLGCGTDVPFSLFATILVALMYFYFVWISKAYEVTWCAFDLCGV